MHALESESGSFRDRHGRVFYRDGEVFRFLSATGLADWEALSRTRFFPERTARSDIVLSRQLSADEAAGLHAPGEWAAALRHERIPFLSYPYEWTFGMIRDAALLQLDLLEDALQEGLVLKDASAFNVQWIGSKPVFIDVLSFQRLVPGEPWAGYRQFCQMLLYPMMLQAYKGIPFQPWLRGSIEGIDPAHCNEMMSWRDLLRPGVLTHVTLHAKLQAMMAGSKRNVKSDLRRAGFDASFVLAGTRRLRKLVKNLEWKVARTTWSHYASEHSYGDADFEAKRAFVKDAAASRRASLVWDLGSNTGTFSRIAAEHADHVIAMDADQLAVERMYQSLKAEGNRKILPLLGNVADPSPNLGWLGKERKSLEERGKPGLVLALALIHHLVIGANIPVQELLSWLRSLGSALVIEFVSKQDPMVQQLLRQKEDQYWDYEWDVFERALGDAFEVRRKLPLASGTRALYYATPR